MNKTIQQILEEGKKCGFSTVEAFAEKTERCQYECLADRNDKTAIHSASINRVTARAFCPRGEPVGFSLSKPGINSIKKAFASIFAINLSTGKENFAQYLPSRAMKVDFGIYDASADSIDEARFSKLVDQIDEILIEAPFNELELKKIHLTKVLKKIYIANTNGFNQKYIKTHFDLSLGFGWNGNRMDTGESHIFFDHIDAFKLIARAHNLLHSLTETRFKTNEKGVPIILAPEASAFILREFAEFFKLSRSKNLNDIPFPSILNIVDDPTLNGRTGSVPFDDEGVQSKEKFLIKKGIANQTISDIRTAFRAGYNQSTGNGFRSDRLLFPAVQFSNLYIKPTVLPLRNLMTDACSGVLISLLKLKYIEKDSYVFSAYGYRFTGNSLGEPVHLLIRTSFLSYFLNIHKISRETKFFHSLYNIGSSYILLEAKNRADDMFEI